MGVMSPTMLQPQVTLFAATVLWVVQFAMAGPELTGQLSDLPKGYYVFAKAGPNVRPPKVRKPPYLPISAECQGMVKVLFYLSY